ncbi:MAG: aminopeptidase P family protein [Thermodesulfobacteriota bacterium]
MKSQFDDRIARARAELDNEDIDALLVTTAENRRYLSGFTGEDGGVNESAGALLITRDRLLLLTDSRFTLQAREEAVGYDIHQVRQGFAKELPPMLKQLNARCLGFEAERMPHAEYLKIMDQLAADYVGVTLKPVDARLADVRIKKEKKEIETMRRALEISEAAFEAFISHDLKNGITETRAAWLLEKRLREAGAEAMAFPIIAAFGENSARPHAVCGDRTLSDGLPVLFDWGARLNGYCADISRSFMKGRGDDTYRKVHRTVYEAQQLAIEAVRPGISAREVDAVARQHIERAGYQDRFGHGLGHGVGLAVHESPRVSPLSTGTLEEGMVFTVEPGIYLAGWGGVRIENMVVVRADGAEVLNQSDGQVPERI